MTIALGLSGCVQTWSAPPPKMVAFPLPAAAAATPGPEKPPQRARSVVELPVPVPREALPSELERILARPPMRMDLDVWPRLVESAAVRTQAESEVGSPINAGEVHATRAGRKLTVEVAGESKDAAVARCLAVLRAAERAFHPDDAAAMRFLRDERKRLRAATDERRRALAEPDPSVAFGTVEQARVKLEAARAALDESRMPGIRLMFPLLWAAQNERDGAAQTLLDLSAREGPLHPQVIEARALLASANRRLEAQRAADRDWTRAYLADLDAAPPPRKDDRLPRARAVALSAALNGRDGMVPSAAPIDLADLATDCAHATAERERLATRYGERHPDMMAADARATSAKRAFVAARDARLAELEREIRDYDIGAAASARLRERERLRAELEREATQRKLQQLEHLSSMLADQIDREAERARSGPRVIMHCTPVQ